MMQKIEKYPKGKIPPQIDLPKNCKVWQEALIYVKEHFQENPGELNPIKHYPISFEEAQTYLEQFLSQRFSEFGIYEDAILKESSTLNHSLLSPLMNVGLLQPLEVVNKALSYAEKNNIPINSTEGFVRQIIGWREFIRGMYLVREVTQERKIFGTSSEKYLQAFTMVPRH